MRRLSAKNQLLFVLTLILLFAFMGGSLLNYKMTREAVHSEILRTDLPLTMDNIYSELTSEMTRPLLVSSSMASDTFLRDWATEGEIESRKIIRYLREIKDQYDFFTTFLISEKTKTYYRYNGIHKKISEENLHDGWYFDFLATGKEYEFSVDNDEGAGNTLTIFINYRVVDKAGDLLGVVGVGLKVDSMASTIARYKEKYDRSVFLTDKDGVFQLHPDTSLIEIKSIQDLEGIGPIASTILQHRLDPGNFEYQQEDQNILLTVRFIDSFDWFLYVEQNETKALKTARNNFSRTILIGFVASILIISFAIVTINRYQAKIELLAASDELTGAANRRALEAEFRKTVYAHSRDSKEFCLILLDLDSFKQVNDTFGHLVGDQILVAIVGLIQGVVRPSDIFARWGGDEFVVLTGNNIKEAIKVAERIRQAVRDTDFSGHSGNNEDARNRVRVSSGISSFLAGDNLDSMVLRADEAMYRCKADGGDGIKVEGC